MLVTNETAERKYVIAEHLLSSRYFCYSPFVYPAQLYMLSVRTVEKLKLLS